MKTKILLTAMLALIMSVSCKNNEDEVLAVRLDKTKLAENGFSLLPTWQDALRRYLKEIEE